ncbi:MAG TPA: hypothetical protein RMH99_12670 [Sandaracinaceae bacterium LLY-WYZ-13_1]|nr:hypothetical protein [Sandaracinaceae bacterium LLY-WYZ-13_1]
MAEDALTEVDAPAEKDSGGEPAAPEAKPGAPHLAFRIALGAAGLCLLIGFFLPWVKIQSTPSDETPQEVRRELVSYSGLELASTDDDFVRAAAGGDTQRQLLWLIPLFGLALTAVGFLGFRWSGLVGAVLGLLLVGYGVVTVVMIFFQNTHYGLWLVLLGAFVAVSTGTLSWARAHRAKKATKAKDTDLKLPDDDDA